jgi:DUF1680 family protein
VTDPFWSRYAQNLTTVTIPHQYRMIVETGRLSNFRRAAGAEEGGHASPYLFDDSDVYKLLETCAYALVHEENAEVRRIVEELTSAIEAAQEPSGYLNTYMQLKHPDFKWRYLAMLHEMYCIGHLVEAAVAFLEGHDDRRLLDVALRAVEHIMSEFGPEASRGYPGHQELELALIRLAGATGEAKYHEFARWLVEQRGQRPSVFEAEIADPDVLALHPYAPVLFKTKGEYSGEYAQDHVPVRDLDKVVGHSVRAMYYAMAATDLADGQGDERLERALESMWTNLTKRRMYITGGIGSSASNEGFTTDFDLPNLTAYAETCAAVALVLWARRMLELTANSEYADAMERALYNGALAGINLQGDRYFYANPLESRGQHDRTPWHGCACCPPNIARLLGSVGNQLLSVGDRRVYIHIPAACEANVEIDGVAVNIQIEGSYPWDGKFTVEVNPAKPLAFALCVRIPGWADDVQTDLPGAEEEAEFESGYAIFDRTWKAGDTLTVDFEMTPKWMEADPRVRENLGRSALTMGPLVYCLEEVDLGYAPQLFTADTDAEIEVRHDAKRLEGVNLLTVEGMYDVEVFVDELYADGGTTDVGQGRATYIPYFAWNNRGPNSMQVWTRRL